MLAPTTTEMPRALQSETETISRAFQRAIKKAQEDVETARRKFGSLSVARNNEMSYLESDNFSERDNDVLAELTHAEKNLRELLKKQEVFLQSPEEYRRCVSCRENISAERHEEVPQTQHCVQCKNGNNS